MSNSPSGLGIGGLVPGFLYYYKLQYILLTKVWQGEEEDTMSTGFQDGHLNIQAPLSPGNAPQSVQHLQVDLPPQLTAVSTSQLTAAVTSTSTTEQVLFLFQNADEKTLRDIICHCTNALNKQQIQKVDNNHNSKLGNQFKVIPDVLTTPSISNEAGTLLLSPSSTIIPENPTTFLQNLTEEVKSLGLEVKCGTSDNRKVASQWLILDSQNVKLPSLWNPHKTNLPPDDLCKFTQINKLRNIISRHTGDTEYNSCIVNYYKDGAARTRPHSDDETYIDQTCPISCFSIGQTREIGVFNKGNGHLIGKHSLEEGSLLVMSAGAQANTKHQLLPMRTGTCGERFSISFRRINISHGSDNKQHIDKVSVESEPSTNTASKTTLVLGTSIPYYLDFKKLSGTSGNVNVVNLCKRGAKICHLQDILDKHYTEENVNQNVDKIIVSVGTNDIQNNKRHTVGHLYTPMQKLLAKIKTYYPAATVYVQSLLPQKIVNSYTVSNVLGFNRLLLRLCAQSKCYFIDLFTDFLGENNHINPKLYRWDGIHLSNKGLSLLARAFIANIRGRFNPVIRG